MKHHRTLAFILILFCLSSAQVFSQTGAFEIWIYSSQNYSDDLRQNKAIVCFKQDTLIRKVITEMSETLASKGLMPGIYSLTLINVKNDKVFFATDFKVSNDSLTEISFSHDFNIHTRAIADSLSTGKTEGRFSMHYGDNAWDDPKSPVKNYFAFTIEQGGFASMGKHAAVIGGQVFSWSHSYFKNDSSLISLDKRKYERYAYFSYGGYLGLRLASHNIKKAGPSKGMFFDMGANYNFPLYFRHAAVYSGHEKILHGNIHLYTDIRGFVRLGWYPVQLSLEYRFIDFLKGNYPQLPRYFAGISFFGAFD